jgi:hypothetical protein
MKSKNVMWSCLVLLTPFFTSCSKDPLSNLSQEDSRIYITDYDSTASFSGFKTFSISDSVTVINNGQSSRQSTNTDQAFISAIRGQLVSRGYQYVDRSANPDLGINVTRIYNTSSGIIQYDNFYNNYYGSYWDPFYWGYGGFGYYSPYSYASYSVTEGALSIDGLDLKNAQANNRIKIIWTGLIRGSGIFNAATAGSQVKQLFDQSPYLKTNQ